MIDLAFNCQVAHFEKCIKDLDLIFKRKEKLMILIIGFQVKFFYKSRIREYCILPRYKNNIHDWLVMFEKQEIPTKLQRRNRSLKYERDWKSSYVKFNHKIIVTWFCESIVSHIYSSKGFVENK